MAEQHHEDEEQRERGKVIDLIDKATNSIEREVDHRLLKAIKMVVRYSDFELKLAAQTLIQLMKRPHSQIRYLALLIIDELFMRSKLFRTLITENLDQLLSLSVGFRRNQPLPDPPSVATVLRLKAIEFLEKWNNSFGIHYRQIRLGYHYLKNTLRYQFPNLQANAARVEQERKERELRTQEILKNKFESLRENLPSIREGIRTTVDEIGECLKIAKANDENVMGIPLDNDSDEEEFEIRNPELRQIRLNALKEAEKIHENTENKVVFDALRESYKLLVTKHLASVQQWISVVIRVEVDDTRFRDSTLKEFIDFRNRILAVKKKCEESGCTMLNVGDDEEEDIWEEGKTDYVETTQINKALKIDAPESSTRRVIKKETREVETGKYKAKVAAANVDSNSLKGKLLAEAPVVNWASALDNWGEKRDALANQRGLELDSHWGRVDHDAAIPAEKIAELNFHASVYEEEQAEIQPCRARLRKGGLCDRRDLRVCPFHGPIIPRDDQGTPICSRDEGPSASQLSPDDIEEMNIDEEDISMEKLAKQAVKNVRKKDNEEAKKREVDKRALKKAKLAVVRDHNDAVLREASTSMYAGFGEHEGGAIIGERGSTKTKKVTLASMLKKKVTAKDRLAQKLLSGRARKTTMKHPM
ncbi:UV-stimulated scaffold protein A homolog [Silene latifolia]|uniref:UV-stimulated scaffold protein A homolog n=1 Tax=Silene latifolia TaxID=37657 RepID=UPI003D779D54